MAANGGFDVIGQAQHDRRIFAGQQIRFDLREKLPPAIQAIAEFRRRLRDAAGVFAMSFTNGFDSQSGMGVIDVAMPHGEHGVDYVVFRLCQMRFE